MASPPKCSCGLYAIGECVDCDIPLCSSHGDVTLEQFRCASHGEAALAKANMEAAAQAERVAAKRSAAEAKRQAKRATAEAARQHKLAAIEAERRAEATRQHKLAAAEAARQADLAAVEAARRRALAKARVERYQVSAAIQQERDRRARTAPEAKLFAAAFPGLRHVNDWVETGMTVASGAPWVNAGFDGKVAAAWFLAFKRRRGSVVPASVRPTYGPEVALEWLDAGKSPELAMTWGFVPFCVFEQLSKSFDSPTTALAHVVSARDESTKRLLAPYGITAADLYEASRRASAAKGRPVSPSTEICVSCGAALNYKGGCRCS